MIACKMDVVRLSEFECIEQCASFDSVRFGSYCLVFCLHFHDFQIVLNVKSAYLRVLFFLLLFV